MKTALFLLITAMIVLINYPKNLNQKVIHGSGELQITPDFENYRPGNSVYDHEDILAKIDSTNRYLYIIIKPSISKQTNIYSTNNSISQIGSVKYLHVDKNCDDIWTARQIADYLKRNCSDMNNTCEVNSLLINA
jgi:hypothetical protein